MRRPEDRKQTGACPERSGRALLHNRPVLLHIFELKARGKAAIFVYGIINLKRWLRWAAAAVLMAGAIGICSTLFTVLAADSGVQVPVIMYHAVIDDGSRLGKYVISPEELESDFKWLKENGYTAVLSEDLIRYVEEGMPLPEKPVLLTFDDGYYNNYLYAYPLAKKYGMRFVISPIGKYTDLYTQTPNESPYYSHCTWKMLKEMQDSGLVEVGNHTYDLHSSDGSRLGTKRLSTESLEEYRTLLTGDILLAQERIKENLGWTPVLFAYPFGAVSEGEPEIIESMGFAVTLSCEERTSTVTRDPESLTYLGRYLRPSGESGKVFFSRILK